MPASQECSQGRQEASAKHGGAGGGAGDGAFMCHGDDFRRLMPQPERVGRAAGADP